ncbi:nuclear envelope integral membrane protein 1-like isoform X2 [Acropora palmata]|uniref:nuclear envelope integral membrane protein 1-like isoform X2 n=1 Tax=Acropora palmata TaxID=6131 RepID=UPI003DA1A775
MASNALVSFLVLSFIFWVALAHTCEYINMTRLPYNSSRFNHAIAVCLHGDELSLTHLWDSVKVELNFDETDVHTYEADSCDALDPDNRTWGSVLQSMVKGSNVIDNLVFKLSPFKTSCFAVDGKLFNARWSAKLYALDWPFPAAFFTGLIIFYNAERLSRNTLFFYSSGVSLGVIMSLLVVVYILHRMVPWRGGAYAVLIGGWSLGGYLIQWTLGNLKGLILNNNQWIIGYLFVAGVMSFCVCYYYGPVTSGRGLDLIRWMLQFVGLTLLYMGTRSDEVSLALVVLVFFSHIISRSGSLLYFARLLPRNWISYRVHYFFFPPKHQFLSLEEYILQGSEETRLALEDLREYCNSPDCNAWKTISRLRHPQSAKVPKPIEVIQWIGW